MLRHRLGLCRLFHVKCSRALLNHYGNVVPLKNVGFDLVSRRWNGSSVGSGHLEESVQSDERIGDIDIPVSCSGCGVRFQTEDKFKAGYLPPDQAEELKKEQAALLEKANLEGISWRDVAEREFSKLTDQIHRDTMKKKVFREFNEDTVPMEVNDPLLFEENEPIDSNTLLMASLNRNQNRSFVRKKEFPFPASNTAAPELLSYDEYKRLGKGPREIVCSRCYQIKRSNSVSDGMEGIVATDFRPLLVERLCSTGNGTAIVILVMDLLDLHGSFIPDIKNVVKANNPVIIALNKADLFGKGIVLERIRHWAIQEIKAMGLAVHKVHLISSMTGIGIRRMMSDVTRLASENLQNVYVVGATNVGKSTLINRLAEKKYIFPKSWSSVRRIVRSTTSSIPGTTLGLIPFRLHGKGTTERLGKSIAIRLRRCLLFDTPGLVRFGHLHQFFQGRDQQALVYSSRVHPVTLVLKPDQVVILGTQVLLHHKSSKPFMYSIFVPKSVSVHVANKNRVPELLDKHVGTILFPPFNPESLANCPSYLRQTFRKEFDNGRRAQWEIAFDGLGWVSFTGKGFLEIEIASMTPGVWVRKPIMPNEAFRKTLTALRGNTLGTKPKSLRGKSIEMKQFPASEHLKVREFLDVSPNPISSPQIPS